ncbi:MAG: relaxase domain-containing protein [Acidobacteriota bacterium]|nr:relaxase domain-containing protein [Acidobacteriota bacterium]
MLTIRALTGGETYASRHLSANDYYAEGERITGHWIGRGAEMLGLEGAVTMEQFDAIRQGIHPETGEYLRPRVSADRFAKDGERQGTARNLYDFTVSAPKSVSVQALFDPRLREAHTQALQVMAGEMERLAGTRVRLNGADENRVTGNLVIAAYQHDTSRELDPQLHGHLVAANLTYDGAEGRWKALQAADIYEQRAYLTEVYRNSLAGLIQGLGYETVDRFDKGRERGFELVGVEPETLEKFSQRSEQRDLAIEKFIAQEGRLPTNREIAVLVRESRQDKLTEISTAEVRAQQAARFTREEQTQLQALALQAQQRGPILSVEQRAAASLLYAREHVFERVSVAQEHELKTEALRHGRGHIQLEELKLAALRDEQRGLVLKVGTEIATTASIERERALIQTIQNGLGQYPRLGGVREFVVSDRLRPEQKHAVEVILDSRDLAVNLRGAAGTGKTATLQELERGLREGGHQIVAVAPTRSAVEELEKVGFGHAMTIERLLQDPAERQGLRGQVLLVDEAGMVSSRQMAELVHLAERSRARVLFSGDTQQIQSVEAGDALRVLEQQTRLQSVSLRQVQRQTLVEYRAAVEELRQNPGRGFQQLEQIGAVREVEWALRPQEVSQAYREALALPNAKGQTREVLVVAPTHEEIRRLTAAIRSERQHAGELGVSQTLTRDVPLHWTQAQKQEIRQYKPGLVLAFHKATKQVTKNESVEVVRVDQDKLTARKENGREITLTRRQAQAYSVHERQEIAVAAGDKLLLEANRREQKFRATNGELVTVAKVEQGRIELEDGRVLPGQYRAFDHGYVVTAHRSQGKTVDAVIVSGDRMSKELFYVAATRGRESLTVITSDKEQLREAIGISGERTSATELVQKAEQAAKGQRMTAWNGSPGQGLGLDGAAGYALWQAAVQEREEQARGPLQRTEQELALPRVEQRMEEKKQKQVIEHGYGIGF